MPRLIVLDTETTGFSPANGDRIVEIGCVELIDLRKGTSRQWYINPQRDIPADAIKVHGITNEKVADAPLFVDIVDQFLDYIGHDSLVIHNAAFDMGFLNAELNRAQRAPIAFDRAIDTLAAARRKFPGTSASLDALCKRLGIDNTQRTLHGALLDANLLAEVYVELCGGNQFTFDLAQPEPAPKAISSDINKPKKDLITPARVWPISEEESRLHENFLGMLDKKYGICLK
ncbi:MAG: DNA polymerase III subunit epsilon [Magnetococcus sp. DMHC-6]